MSEEQNQIKSGFDGVPASAYGTFEPPASRDPRPRYLFFGGDVPYTHTPQYPAGGLWVESRCVANQICQRCDITPVMLHSPRAQVEYIPDGMGIPGTEVEAGTGPVRLALQSYYDYPGPVVENLIKGYSDWGLVELVQLRGYPPITVKNFKLREFFFPDWPKLPKSNPEVIDELERKLEIYSVLESLDEEARTLICSVGDQMLRSVRKYQEWLQFTIDDTHGRFGLGGEDRDKKRRYDRLDIVALERTGTARRDNELNLMARQSNSLAQALKDALQSVLQPAAPTSGSAPAPPPIPESRIEELIKATEAMHETLKQRSEQDSAIINRVAATLGAESAAELARSIEEKVDTMGVDATGDVDLYDEPPQGGPVSSPGLKIGKRK